MEMDHGPPPCGAGIDQINPDAPHRANFLGPCGAETVVLRGNDVINTSSDMAQTHLSLHAHLVFHTKDNRRSISEEWRERLHAFLGGCLKTAGCIPEAVGGTTDHVHLLVGFRATHCVADIVKDIKVASSKWVHQEIGHRMFAWQGGYCAITVSPRQINRVKRYIANQMEHHRLKSSQEEYVELLDAAGVEYDPKYLWN